MASVIEHRREYLRLMRQFTVDNGYFSVTDIQTAAGIPRSTAQDWVNRLVQEGCVFLKDEKRGRNAARYAAISAMPSSTCRRIFTTVDGEKVEIFHDCMSGACAAFCGYHHTLAGGALTNVERDGTLLRECGRIGSHTIAIGLSPLPAVGVAGIEQVDDFIVQHIRCIGGPAYSLTDMMARAEGVVRVEPSHAGELVKGNVWTQALTHVTIGLDDTDSKEGGATFALALALLTHVTRQKGVLPISHHVVMLNQNIFLKTAGNSASYIEVAAMPSQVANLVEKILRFVADEALSLEWGVAIRTGICIPDGLRDYGRLVREEVISRAMAKETAERFGIALHGGNGVIGALGAVALARLPHEILLDPTRAIS
ncbi:MAG: sugar-specific transcriptional regulator TrmB [Methanoregula sp.]|nr:sugar-specific transcriptional regulator TrmB [Methanoregula sp.]